MALLELNNISKSFGNNMVLKNVNFTLHRGEIHALLGENGAGKSTMLNVIGGLYKADGGVVKIDDKEVAIDSVTKAKELGIGFVHQEIELCQDVSVAENILMPTICDKNARFCVDYNKVAEDARKILNSLVGDAIDPKEIVSNLPISQQQIVEIAKAISSKCRILLLDEPTAALSEVETNALFRVMHKLTEEGIGIIYISHRMSEIFEQSDIVTVLRDGVIVSTYNSKDAQINQLMKDMAGREIQDIYPPKAESIDYSDSNILLEVSDLTDKNDCYRNFDLKLYKGEILGIAGLVGAGRTEIVQTIVNLRRRSSGKVLLVGENIDKLSTADIYKKGLILMSEDRKKSGLFLEYDIKTNVGSTFIDEVSRGMLISDDKENELAKKKVKENEIKCSSVEQIVGTLSGGNQQKVLLAKLLAKESKVVIFDEPTRGVDAGAKADIGQYIRGLANRGIGVIIISSEMNELLGLCDRLTYVDIDGDQVKEDVNDPFNSDIVMYYISGAYKYEK